MKEESHAEVTSSGGTPSTLGKKSSDPGSSGRGARHSVRSISDPIFLKPFEQGVLYRTLKNIQITSYFVLFTINLTNPIVVGWKRELVYRKTEPKGGDGTKRTGDIYYYTPVGKKVRSRVEILEHCKYLSEFPH